MNRKLFTAFVICTVIFVVSIWFCFYRTSASSLGVTMSPRGSRTNAIVEVVQVFAISNAGQRVVWILPGFQTGPRSYDFSGFAAARELQQGKEEIVELPSARRGHAMVHCQQEAFGSGWQGKVKRFWNVKVLRRPVVEFVTAQASQ
jgi:hypothetical protein